MMKTAEQTVKFETMDEQITAAFNELELEIEATVVSRHIRDSDGAYPFMRDFDSFEDPEVVYPIEIDGLGWEREELVDMMGLVKTRMLEQKIIDHCDPDAWSMS